MYIIQYLCIVLHIIPIGRYMFSVFIFYTSLLLDIRIGYMLLLWLDDYKYRPSKINFSVRNTWKMSNRLLSSVPPLVVIMKHLCKHNWGRRDVVIQSHCEAAVIITQISLQILLECHTEVSNVFFAPTSSNHPINK